MFDIGWTELLVIGVVALIAIGPKELPGVLRMVGQWMGKIRRMASEFQGQFHEAMREAEMADIKKQVDEMGAAASDLTNFNYDPMETVRKEMEAATGDISLDAPVKTSNASTAADAVAGAAPEPASPAAPSEPSPQTQPPQPEPAAGVAEVAVAPTPAEPKAETRAESKAGGGA